MFPWKLHFDSHVFQISYSVQPKNFFAVTSTLLSIFIQRFVQIQVRERILHMGLIPKVIPRKLFLDMIPSASEDVTRAMRGQPK